MTSFNQLLAQLSSQHDLVVRRNEALAEEVAELRRATAAVCDAKVGRQMQVQGRATLLDDGGLVGRMRSQGRATLLDDGSLVGRMRSLSSRATSASLAPSPRAADASPGRDGGVALRGRLAMTLPERCSRRPGAQSGVTDEGGSLCTLATLPPRECRSSTPFGDSSTRRGDHRVDPWLQMLHTVRTTEPLQQEESSWLINPETSDFLRRWDALALAALGFVSLVTPVQVAILQPSIDWLFVVSSVVDLVFFVDLVLQFFMVYTEKANFGIVMVSNHKKIVKHYLETWFFVDLISIFPFDIIGFVLEGPEGSELKMLKMVRLLRLLKLTRMLRASRIVRRFEMRMTISYSRLALLKFFAVLAVLTHWLANLWALTLVIVDEGEGVPRWIDGFVELEGNVSNPTKDTPWKVYATCLYFTSYTITSVGYGDIGPANITERIVCTLMIVVSGIVWAVVLGQVSDVVTTMNSDEQAFQRQMDELNSMVADQGLPQTMRTRLRHFFLSSKVVARQRARRYNLMKAMSPGLKAEVAMELNRPWLSKVSVLQRFLRERAGSSLSRHFRAFISEVCQFMSTVVHAQAEAVGKPQTLFIVSVGLVTQNCRLLGSGMLWGSDFVLSCSRQQKNYEAFALTYLELTVLRRSDFMDALETHRDACPEIAQHVRRYCCWCAFQRELKIEARRRRAERAGHMVGHLVSRNESLPTVRGDEWSAKIDALGAKVDEAGPVSEIRM